MQMDIKENANDAAKTQLRFYCKHCDYTTSKKSSFDNHKLSRKHTNTINGNVENAKMPVPHNLTCQNCDKVFETVSGLWKHKKKCVVVKSETQLMHEIAKTISDKDELIMFLIKENSEFKNIMIEQQKNFFMEQHNIILKILENGAAVSNSHNTTTTTTTNSHNKAFNLQFFLNETCKDAMNITDFVNSIKLQLSDLEKFGEVGYVEGICNIISTNLKALHVTQRPVHCTDKKRETMYVKDENQWEKEDENNSKLRKAIKRIADKNIRLLPLFREKYPEYKNSSSKVSDRYDKMVVEAMDCDEEKNNKIIKRISHITTIEKMMQ